MLRTAVRLAAGVAPVSGGLSQGVRHAPLAKTIAGVGVLLDELENNGRAVRVLAVAVTSSNLCSVATPAAAPPLLLVPTRAEAAVYLGKVGRCEASKVDDRLNVKLDPQ